MANFKLTTAHDLAIEDDNLVIVAGVDAIAQDCDTRLKHFLGEWFLDQRLGVPYFEKILGHKPRIGVVKNILRKAILSTPGIVSISDYVVTYDGVSRDLSISFQGNSVEGPFIYNKELIV